MSLAVPHAVLMQRVGACGRLRTPPQYGRLGAPQVARVEQRLAGGNTGGAVRVGDTVRCTPG